jgi:hypothetical protein
MISMRASSAELCMTMLMAGCALAASAHSRTPQRCQAVPDPPPTAPSKSPYASSRPAVASSQEPAGIAWGPGREVQAGLLLGGRYGGVDQRTGLYVFDVYIRNVSKQAITVDCPGYDGLSVPGDDRAYTTLKQNFQIFCSPSIKDSGGKPVSVSFREGKNHAGIPVGPGQCVMVSHWMLRTIKLASKTPEQSRFTQVAFVDPGKYAVTCSLRASWGSRDGRRAMLSTGKLGFNVTDEDLAP